MMQNEGELDEQELLEGENQQQMEENDSESDHRFPYVEDTLNHYNNVFGFSKKRRDLWQIRSGS